MLRIGWLENPDNIVYADLNEFADNFGNEVGISNLKQEILNFRQNPTAEGIVLKGKKRSALKLFVPDMLWERTCGFSLEKPIRPIVFTRQNEKSRQGSKEGETIERQFAKKEYRIEIDRQRNKAF